MIFFNFFPSTLVAFSCQMCTNLTYLQRKALKQLEQSPRKKEIFTVYTFEGLSFIFYKDEFKVYLNTLEEMRLPLVT